MKCALPLEMAQLLFCGVPLFAQTIQSSTEQKPESPATYGSGSGLDVLSDTMGVDFGPYLQGVLANIRKNWYNLIPSEARAPTKGGVLLSEESLAWNSFQGGTMSFSPIHSMKFGVLVERMQDNELSLPAVNGRFRFDSLLNFLTNRPLVFQRSGSPDVPDVGLRQTLSALMHRMTFG